MLATVYNNLNMLCDKELIRKISLEGSPDRYDRKRRHDHLVCRKCGRLSDMVFEDLTATLSAQLKICSAVICSEDSFMIFKILSAYFVISLSFFRIIIIVNRFLSNGKSYFLLLLHVSLR